MKGRRAVLGALASLAVSLFACGDGGEGGAEPVTTTTLTPEAMAAGQEVCNALFSDPTMVPSLDRAQVAGPQLAAIVEELGAVVTDKDQGRLTREQFVTRLTTLLPAFEIACEDRYGVSAPPGFPDLSGS